MNQSIDDPATDRAQTPTSAMRPLLLDVQPILERRIDSIWTRVEQTRDTLCDALRHACKKEGFDALVIKSHPFVHPAWVKLECWIPKNSEVGNAVTERGLVLVKIRAREFYRHELEYSVELKDRGRPKTYSCLSDFGPIQVEQIVRFLLVHGHKPKLGNLELRTEPTEIWKPANKVNVLRTDWLRLSPVVLITLGIVFLLLIPLSLDLLPLGMFFLGSAGLVFYRLHKRHTVVLSPGKPVAEPRILSLIDSWQTMISELGTDAGLLRQRFLAALCDPPITGLKSWVEAIWYWGLDGKVEREQIVLTLRRAILFCQIYQYDRELYVGWDTHLNHGQWIEKTVATGIHKKSGEFTEVKTVESGWQPLTEYDVTDVNCLIEWTHWKLVQLVKRLMEERNIDQEIDFKIIRGDRQDLAEPQQTNGRTRQGTRRGARKLERVE
jgi:hypothetical protein